MRSKDEVRAAEQEHFDRLWYYRDSQIPHSDAEITERVKAAVVAAMESKDFVRHLDPLTAAERDASTEYMRRLQAYRIEGAYGESLKTVTPEYVSGALSALRWVLGNDWHNLDT